MVALDYSEDRSKILQFFKKRNQITTDYCTTTLPSRFKDTSIFQKAQSNHNRYTETKKNRGCSKILQFFKKRNQITTQPRKHRCDERFKDTSIFQKAQSNHNSPEQRLFELEVQRYFNFSKSAIKSQQKAPSSRQCVRSKILQFFKKRNQITTPLPSEKKCTEFKDTSIFQKAQSNHNKEAVADLRLGVQRYFNFSKSAIKSQQRYERC